MNENIPLERDIVSSIVKALKKVGVTFIWKTHGGDFQSAGLPDLILIAPRTGRFVGLEVKRPKLGRVTPLQEATIHKINQSGGYAAVVYNSEEALKALAVASKP